MVNSTVGIRARHARRKMARRADPRTARDKLGDQFDELRACLPPPPPGAELGAKAQVLEHSIAVIRALMARATDLAVGLAVDDPPKFVRDVTDAGRRPLEDAIAHVMKLFCRARAWKYAEWWTLDEQHYGAVQEHLAPYFSAPRPPSHPPPELASPPLPPVHGERAADAALGAADALDGAGSPARFGPARFGAAGAADIDAPANLHGCVVRDTVSVMRLRWTLIQRVPSLGAGSSADADVDDAEEEALAEFARASTGFQFRPRVGMPGRVWSSRRAEWLAGLDDSEAFRRSPLASQFGMKTCLAVPLVFGGEVHSVMAFYTTQPRPYDPTCLDLATALSDALREVYAPPSSAGPWQMSSEMP